MQDSVQRQPGGFDSAASRTRVVLALIEDDFDSQALNEAIKLASHTTRFTITRSRPEFLEAVSSYQFYDAGLLCAGKGSSELIHHVWSVRPEFPIFRFLGLESTRPAAAAPEHVVDLERIEDLAPLLDNRVRASGIDHALLHAAFHASEDLFHQIAANIDDMLWVRTIEGRYIYMSVAMAKIFGVEVETLFSDARNPQLKALHEQRRTADKLFADAIGNGEPFTADYPFVAFNGVRKTLREKGFPIRDADGVVRRYAGTVRDITEETKMAQDLQLHSKLQSIGQLAAGIAHEINTPAQYTGDNLRFLETGLDDVVSYLRVVDQALANAASGDIPAEQVEALRASREAADVDYVMEEIPRAISEGLDGVARITTIVGAMKEFSHPGSKLQETVSLNRTIESTTVVSRNEWKYNADLDLEFDPELPPVRCYPQMISQVVLNLIVNAAHAISERHRDNSTGRIVVRTQRDGDHVIVRIGDNGGGIPAEIRARVFDPFFTTKEVGKGTGQGLAMARTTIIDGHGGTIDFEVEENVGTEFTIRIPINGINSETQESDDEH
ncbi:MAG: PAS domain S-box protein [Gammaproteobacteria bacterium]|nr:PAS domain S-box protein [Gammaproteobacteria bacterium]